MRAEGTAHLRAPSYGLLLGLVALIGLGLIHASIGSGRVIFGATLPPPLCLGSNDLIVDGINGGSGMTLQGTHTYGSVCVRNNGILLINGQATVRAGIFYVDSHSRIDADGRPGGITSATDCASTGNGRPDGDSGGTLVVRANTAIVAGHISADGGAGFDSYSAGGGPCPDEQSGNGGLGGHITIEADIVALSGSVSARGGRGGTGKGPGNGATGDGTIGRGGQGGTITVDARQYRTATLVTSFDVAGGKDGKTGQPALAGHVREAGLTSAQRATLPPAPSPLVAVLGAPPARLLLQAVSVFGQGMSCGSGDLTIPAGKIVSLAGSHTYRHVCVRGVLRTARSLTVRAQTILLPPGGSIVADGTVPAGRGPTGGRYEAMGACGVDRGVPHVGVPGSAGSMGGAEGIHGGNGGAAGGRIILEARRMLLSGTLSVAGTAGGSGDAGAGGSPSSGPLAPGGGGGGGSGGGVLLVADTAQIGGTITAIGGPGGHPGADSGHSRALPVYGPVGGPGCIKILANTLRAPDLTLLPIPGPALIGHTVPADSLP